MKYSEFHTLPIALTVLAALGGAALVSAQSIRNERVSLNNSRPMAKAVEAIEAKYGVAISYEDPEYSLQADTIDTTDPLWRQQNLSDPRRALAPRGGVLEFNVQETVGALKRTNAGTAIATALGAHEKSGLPGRFRYLQDGEELFVVPTHVRDTRGVLGEKGSPLDAVITLVRQERNGLQALQAIFDEVQRATGAIVFLGNVPLNFLSNQSVVIEATNEQARHVLVRVLRGLRWRKRSHSAEAGNRMAVVLRSRCSILCVEPSCSMQPPTCQPMMGGG